MSDYPTNVTIHPSPLLMEGGAIFINGQNVTSNYVKFESQSQLGDVSRAVITLRHPVPLDFSKGMKIEMVVRPIEEGDLDVDLYVARRAMMDVKHWIMRGVVEDFALSASHEVVRITCIVTEGDRRYTMPPPAVKDMKNVPELEKLWKYMATCAPDGRVGFDVMDRASEHLGIMDDDVEGLVRRLMDEGFMEIILDATNSGNVKPTGYALSQDGYNYFRPGSVPVDNITRDEVVDLLHTLNFWPDDGTDFDKAVDEVYRRMHCGPDFRLGQGLLQNLPLDCDYGFKISRSEQA